MEYFTVYADEIEGRIDPSPYHPTRLKAIKQIKSSKYELLPLKEVAEFKKELVTSNSKTLIYVGLKNIESNTGIFIPSDEEKQDFGSAFLFKKGDILFPKLRPYLNKVYLADFDGVCSTEFHILKPIKCEGVYLFTFLNSQLVVNQTSYLMTGNTLPRLQTGEVKSLIIPIPPKPTQTKIVGLMEKAYSSKKQKESEAKQLLDSINDYILDELGIKLPELKNKMTYVVYAADAKGRRIDPHFYRPEFIELIEELTKLKHKKLGDVIEFSSETWNQNDMFEDEFPYIEIGEIDLASGKIQKITYYNKNKAPSRAKMIVRKGDIIVSTTRPHRGAISLIDKEKNGFIVSTGFVILRESKIKIDRQYLLYILRTQLSLRQMLQRSSGGNYPAITSEELKDIIIPLPSREVQNKIAEEVKKRMQKAEQLQKVAKEDLEKAKQEVERIILG